MDSGLQGMLIILSPSRGESQGELSRSDKRGHPGVYRKGEMSRL